MGGDWVSVSLPILASGGPACGRMTGVVIFNRLRVILPEAGSLAVFVSSCRRQDLW